MAAKQSSPGGNFEKKLKEVFKAKQTQRQRAKVEPSAFGQKVPTAIGLKINKTPTAEPAFRKKTAELKD